MHFQLRSFLPRLNRYFWPRRGPNWVSRFFFLPLGVLAVLCRKIGHICGDFQAAIFVNCEVSA